MQQLHVLQSQTSPSYNFVFLFPKFRVGVLKWLKRAFLLEIPNILVDLNRLYPAREAFTYTRPGAWAQSVAWNENPPYK